MRWKFFIPTFNKTCFPGFPSESLVGCCSTRPPTSHSQPGIRTAVSTADDVPWRPITVLPIPTEWTPSPDHRSQRALPLSAGRWGTAGTPTGESAIAPDVKRILANLLCTHRGSRRRPPCVSRMGPAVWLPVPPLGPRTHVWPTIGKSMSCGMVSYTETVMGQPVHTE